MLVARRWGFFSPRGKIIRKESIRPVLIASFISVPLLFNQRPNIGSVIRRILCMCERNSKKQNTCYQQLEQIISFHGLILEDEP